MESFGLPIVEAIELGCKIIVSDLPFANSICKPSLVFNPNDKIEIAKAISFSMNHDLKNSRLNTKDYTKDLIKVVLK